MSRNIFKKRTAHEVSEITAKVRGQKQSRFADCQRKTPKKNIRQNCLAVSQQCEELYHARKIDGFENLAKFTADKEQRYQQLETVHLSKG